MTWAREVVPRPALPGRWGRGVGGSQTPLCSLQLQPGATLAAGAGGSDACAVGRGPAGALLRYLYAQASLSQRNLCRARAGALPAGVGGLPGA